MPFVFCYMAELIEFIRSAYRNDFYIYTAACPQCHPQFPSIRADMENFARTIRTGTHATITLYFCHANDCFRFVDEARQAGIDAPAIPGIMPITNFTQLMHFSALYGAEILCWIAKRLENFREDRSTVYAFDTNVVTRLCHRLMEGGAPGFLYFYTHAIAQLLRIFASI